MSYGLDLNYWSGFLGMAQFQKDFGRFDEATKTYIIPTTWQSVASGTPTAAIACGTLLAGYMGNRLGRIKSFWIAASIGIVGILIQASAISSFWQVLMGRIVNGISMGIICKYACLLRSLPSQYLADTSARCTVSSPSTSAKSPLPNGAAPLSTPTNSCSSSAV